jgi:exopolysaccharide production protein ExoY
MSSGSALATSLPRQAAPEPAFWRLILALERGASFLLLVLLSPLLALFAAIIAVLSRRSPLVAHLRTGQFGAPLWTLKFRTMWQRQAPVPAGGRLIEYIADESGIEYKGPGDPRVTSGFARFCRRYSIDELPQLINVVRGEMSLVAPRPLTEGELKEHYKFDTAVVLLVKPGITGLWQVSGRSRLTYQQRREMDLFLIRNRSLKLYLIILLRTIAVVLSGKDGW